MEMDESSKQQLEDWYNGISVHNMKKDECCPDFSCCNREIKTTFLLREKFCDAANNNDQETIDLILRQFLEKLLDLQIRKGKIKIEKPNKRNNSV